VTPPPAAAPEITPDEATILAALNTYFSQVVTLRGEFIQESSNRQLSEGVFYLYRPGRVRFEYYPPSQLLIISNGRTLQIENGATGTRDRYPLARTPLAPLVAETIDLTSPSTVRDVRLEGDMIAVELVPAEDGARLTLYFNRTTFDLYQWITLDAQQNTIRFVIHNLATNQPLDLAMFEVPLL
jgi:outer membrane lipoprotein-sorting protein